MPQVRILSTLNRELLKPSASVALHRHSNALVDVLPPEADSSISLLDASERPDVSYSVRPRSRFLYHLVVLLINFLHIHCIVRACSSPRPPVLSSSRGHL